MDPIRTWIRTDPVRRALVTASSSWSRSHGWRKVGIAALIITLICVFLVTATVVLLVFLFKSLSVGKIQNKELYIPGKFQNQDLYIPRIRK